MRRRVWARGGISLYITGYGCRDVLVNLIKNVSALHGVLSFGNGLTWVSKETPLRGGFNGF